MIDPDDYGYMEDSIVEKLRHPEKNEFFFTTHSNIGICEEFERFVKYINENSNIKIIKNDIETLAQAKAGSMYGSPFNFKVIKK